MVTADGPLALPANRAGGGVRRDRATRSHLVPSRPVNEFGFDPQRALHAVKRLASDAPGQLADGVGKLVRDSSPERLEQVMRSPARRAILDGIFWQMPKQIDPKHAAGVKASLRWVITGRQDGGSDIFQLELDDGRCRVIKGSGGPDPLLTITIDGVEFLRLVTGNSDPMKAYFKGRIKLTGDVMFAAKLASLFRMPGSGSDNGAGNGSH
jgi:putative sterol carrier protein